MDLSIIIPVYQAGQGLYAVIDRLIPVLEPLGLSYEIVFVDDGSRDRSWEVLTEIQLQHPDRVTAIQLMRNYGQHNALMAGFRHAHGRLVITMDDDLQNPPEEIPKLLAAIEKQDLDLVYGAYDSKRHRRHLGTLVVTAFYRIVFHSRITPTSFRIMRRELVRSIFSYSLNYTYIDGLLAWNTQRIGEVPVEHRPRAGGRRGYSLPKLLGLAFNLFTNFSLMPLQAVSAFGLLAAGGGLAAALFYLIQYLHHSIAVSGYASTIITVLVLGGVQLLALGIMGEYLGRLHLNVNRKPQYVERQVLSSPSRPRLHAEPTGALAESTDAGEPREDR